MCGFPQATINAYHVHLCVFRPCRFSPIHNSMVHQQGSRFQEVNHQSQYPLRVQELPTARINWKLPPEIITSIAATVCGNYNDTRPFPTVGSESVSGVVARTEIRSRARFVHVDRDDRPSDPSEPRVGGGCPEINESISSGLMI